MEVHSVSRNGAADRFIENTSYQGNNLHSSPLKSTISEVFQKRVANPLQTRLKTFMTQLDSSENFTDVEMTPSKLKLTKSDSTYAAVGQNSPGFSLITTRESDYKDPSQPIPPKAFQPKT